MKKKIFWFGMSVTVLALGLVFAIVFSGCKEEEEEYGSLTVNNLPSVPLANIWGGMRYWLGGVYYEPDNDFTSRGQVSSYADRKNEVASFRAPDGTDSHTSPFSLQDTQTYHGFLKSGIYLVYIYPVVAYNSTSWYGQYQDMSAYMFVTFKNGKATIDYNNMTHFSELP